MTWQELLAATGGSSPAEGVAAAAGVLYVILAIVQSRLCWVAGFLSTAIYLYVFYRSHLYMQAGLQAYYVAAAVYGWWAWRSDAAGAALPVTRAGLRVQLLGLAAVLAAAWTSAAWLASRTGSRDPLLDSLTTWASLFATWLVTRKKIDNWAWWLVVDALILALCWRQKLYPSVFMYGLYIGLAFIGWRSWYRDMTRTDFRRSAVG